MSHSGHDFGHFRTAKARKAHRCSFCFQAITPGMVYERYVGVFEGDWQNWAVHEPCLKAFEEWSDEDGYLPYDRLTDKEYVRLFLDTGVAEEASKYWCPERIRLEDFEPRVLPARWRPYIEIDGMTLFEVMAPHRNSEMRVLGENGEEFLPIAT